MTPARPATNASLRIDEEAARIGMLDAFIMASHNHADNPARQNEGQSCRGP